MSTPHQCLAAMARLSLRSATRPTAASAPRIFAPAATQTRGAAAKNLTKIREAKLKEKKKRKLSKDFKSYDPTKFPQFSLCDAMRYLRAAEVGRPPHAVKYSIAIRLKSPRNGPVIKGRIRLPHNVKSVTTRVAVICPDGSDIAQQAMQAGAFVAGETELLEQIKKGEINFNKLICHTQSEAALNKAGVGRILGPKGLMPSKKLGTVTDKVVNAIQENAGAENYREKQGALRMAVGQLGFTPRLLAANIKAFMDNVKEEIYKLDGAKKEISEVVLSTSHGPGLNLNGLFDSTDEKVTLPSLSQVM